MLERLPMKGPANHEAAPSPFVVDVQLTHRELSLICKALDSNAYEWMLAMERHG